MNRRFLTISLILVCGGVWLARHYQAGGQSEYFVDAFTRREFGGSAVTAGPTNGPADATRQKTAVGASASKLVTH